MHSVIICVIRTGVVLGLLSELSMASAADAVLPPPQQTPAGLTTFRFQAPVPEPILAGGRVVPLYAPDSPHLRTDRLHEPEELHWHRPWQPGGISGITRIHNPSVEFHSCNSSFNTGVAVILVAGGGHHIVNVAGEGVDFVHLLANHGINTVMLRYRLQSDGYPPMAEGLEDVLQAIKVVRARAGEWNLDPGRIGLLGFSEAGEMAAAATLQWAEFDQREDVSTNPLAKISSRPDFGGLIYPEPTPFAKGPVKIPRDTPPSFLASAGWGDPVAALSITEYYTALLKDGVPNVEMHLYARGHHPGDKVAPDEPAAHGGTTHLGGIAFGTWTTRYVEWLRDLGFLDQPGVETRAARDVKANLNRAERKNGAAR